MIRLTDSHCHLDFPDFDGEVAEVIARAQAAGVTRMVTICTRLDQEPKVRAIAESTPGIFYAAGIHPMRAGEHELPFGGLQQAAPVTAARGVADVKRGQLQPGPASGE
jgi:Tat protein secretion system quality control protein TatD with DNase activity